MAIIDETSGMGKKLACGRSRSSWMPRRGPPERDRNLSNVTKKDLKQPLGCWDRVNEMIFWRHASVDIIECIAIIVCLWMMAQGHAKPDMYYLARTMSNKFLDAEYGRQQENGEEGRTFRTLATVDDFWMFVKGPLLDGLYPNWNMTGNTTRNHNHPEGYVAYENRLLGPPKMREMRVRSDSCVVQEEFTIYFSECFDEYNPSIEDTKALSSWEYTKSNDVLGVRGVLTTYSGNGYVQDLNMTDWLTSLRIVERLESYWLTRATRAIIIDFNMYNINVNLFCSVRLLVEFPASGGAIPSWTIDTANVLFAFRSDALPYEIVFIAVLKYNCVKLEAQIQIGGLSSLNFWHILDATMTVTGILRIVWMILRHVLVEFFLAGDKSEYIISLIYFNQIFNVMFGVMVFIAWIRALRCIGFNKTIVQIKSTLNRCATDLVCFVFMFIIVFLGFTLLGHLMFGPQVKDFSTFTGALFTLFRIILGDFDFHDIERADPFQGPLFFILFIFFEFFVLVNIFVAIICDTYSEVKSEMLSPPDENPVDRFFQRIHLKILEKCCGVKPYTDQELRQDAQNREPAEGGGDREGTEKRSEKAKQFDIYEWRQDMKMRGYTDKGIDAIIAQYEHDETGKLTEYGQYQLDEDLRKRKERLERAYSLLAKSRGRDLSVQESARERGGEGDAESDEEDKLTNAPRKNDVSNEEFRVLVRRVDRMESSVGNIVSKIEAVVRMLEALEKQ